MASSTGTPGVILDTSALLAYLFDEPGGQTVVAHLDSAAICSINWSEVIQKCLARAVDIQPLRYRLETIGLQIVPFTAADAEYCAALWRRTHPSGLSLADRACLTLAMRSSAPALTTDREWTRLELGVEVRVIR